MLDALAIDVFRTTIWDYYAEHGRHDLAWRIPEANGKFDPYKIMVSELMLQQTQVSRVTLKYHEFLVLFPTLQSLACAPIGEVLRTWSGLGYNRRAKFLQQAAQQVVQIYGGNVPQTQTELTSLPGIGVNTAGAIIAYAFDQPAVFIETNIRTVFIQAFFANQQSISDGVIKRAVEQTLPDQRIREWYWALMDYGAYLRSQGLKLNMLSNSYKKQSVFVGSKREIRGKVLKLLAVEPLSVVELQAIISDERLTGVLSELAREQLIQQRGDRYLL